MPISIIVLGHRGEGCTNRDPAVFEKKLPPRQNDYYLSKILPENSLSAIEHALINGAQGIECDVCNSSDNVPMVIHDTLLARNVDGYHYWGKEQNEEILKKVSDYTCEELKEKFTIGNGEKIPTLDEVIQLILKHNPIYSEKHNHNYIINIELKGQKSIAKSTYEVIQKYIKDPTCAFTEMDFLFNSFDIDFLIELKKIDVRLRCALGIETKDLFGQIKMPGWIPINKSYLSTALCFLTDCINKMSLSGFDVISADVKKELIKLCRTHNLFLNVASSEKRLYHEAKDLNCAEFKWTNLEREKQEVRKIANYSEKYDLLIYYKSDNPGCIVKYISKFKEIKKLAEKEKEIAEKYLSQVKYNPSLFFSLRKKMHEYATEAVSSDQDLGRELARAYEEVIKKKLR